MNEYFRHMAFAEAVATFCNSVEPPVTVLVQGFDVPIAEICEDVENDQGVMPDDITTALTLVPPATYATGASSLRKRIALA